MDAFTQSTLSFTGQNYGAKKFHRITKVVWYNLILVTGVGIVLGVGAYLLGRPLLSIYSSDPEVIAYGLERMLLVCVPYFTCGIMNILVGAMRGLGSSLTPMVVSIFGVCVLRVVWIYTIFPLDRTFTMLFLSYPSPGLSPRSSKLCVSLSFASTRFNGPAAWQRTEIKLSR